MDDVTSYPLQYGRPDSANGTFPKDVEMLFLDQVILIKTKG